MAMIGKVLRMHRRDKKSVREIALATSLSRNTVRKYLRTDKVEEPRRILRLEAPIKLAPFVEAIKQALLVDARRPKNERPTAKALLKQISEAGYDGSYSRLTDFIRDWRAQQGGVVKGKAFVPLAFELGEAFQFDWSEEGAVIGGIYQRLQGSHMKLCASRALWLVAYPRQGHEMLFDAHTRSFSAPSGVARRGIYDNMRTAVDKVHKGKGRTVNARFAVMCAYYLYDPDFCNVASGWEKGVVEKNVQDSRRRIWVDARQMRFGSIDEPSTAKSVGYLRHLYSFRQPGGLLDTSVERDFMGPHVDDPAAKLHAKILGNGIKSLDYEGRGYWAQFIVSMLLRLPRTMDYLRERAIKHLGDQLEEDPEFARQYDPDTTTRQWVDKHYPEAYEEVAIRTLPMLIQSEKLIAAVTTGSWATRTLDARCPFTFVLGDRSLLYLGTLETRFLIVLPLSPRTAFVFFYDRATW